MAFGYAAVPVHRKLSAVSANELLFNLRQHHKQLFYAASGVLCLALWLCAAGVQSLVILPIPPRGLVVGIHAKQVVKDSKITLAS
jgi:hypothetical protein